MERERQSCVSRNRAVVGAAQGSRSEWRGDLLPDCSLEEGAQAGQGVGAGIGRRVGQGLVNRGMGCGSCDAALDTVYVVCMHNTHMHVCVVRVYVWSVWYMHTHVWCLYIHVARTQARAYVHM